MFAFALVVVAIALVLSALIVGLAWREQERIVWQPPRPPYPAAPSDARRVAFRATDGQELFGYVIGEPNPAGLLIAFHGNADLAVWVLPWAREVARRTGRCVLVPEYRGYAGLGGATTYDGSALDAAAALAFARDSLGAATRPPALYGHSLGSAVAAELAGRAGVEALLLESPFSSARAMARIIIGRPMLAVWGLIARVHFDTVERVRALDAPVWVAHGDRDFIIPVRMGRDVFAAARHKGELLIVRGAGHNDLPDRGGEEYWSWLTRALRGDR